MFQFRTSLAAALVLAAAPLHARTAAQDYYSELKALYERFGMRLEAGSEELDGETLILRDLSFSYRAAGIAVSGTGDMMRIGPSGQPGYSLTVVWPERMTFDTSTDKADADPVVIRGRMDLPGNLTLIGGVPGSRTYAFNADSIRLEYEPVEMGPDGTMAMAFTFGSVAGTGNSTDAEGGAYEYAMSSGDLAVTLAISAPDGALSLTATYRGVKLDAKGPMVGMVDPAQIFMAVGTTDARMDIATSESTVDVTENGVRTVVSTVTGPGRLSVLFGGGQFDYGLDSEATVVEVTGDALPVPRARVEARTMGVRFAMPFVPRESPGLMALDLKLEDITVSEEIWAMADPTGGIPRLPATVILRARSAVSPLVNIMDPKAMENAPPEAAAMPFRFESVSLKEVLVRIAGVELKAAGDAQIRNEGPVPQPVGGFDVTIDGAIALANKLAEIGLVPPEQAAAAPMILGMYAKPGASEDRFTSRIEFTADGQITANGVPLQ